MHFKYPCEQHFTPTEFDVVHSVAKYWNVLVVAPIQYIKRSLSASQQRRFGLWDATELKIFTVNIFLSAVAFFM